MIHETMSRASKKIILKNRSGSKLAFIFRLMDFTEFAINHESQREFQLIISKILGYHNQG